MTRCIPAMQQCVSLAKIDSQQAPRNTFKCTTLLLSSCGWSWVASHLLLAKQFYRVRCHLHLWAVAASMLTGCRACRWQSLTALSWRLQVQRDAISAVEQDGIVFIDEIDKIVVNQDTRYGEPCSRCCCIAPKSLPQAGQYQRCPHECIACATQLQVRHLS